MSNIYKGLKYLGVSSFILFFSCLSSSKPDLPERGICAHRGANSTHPENTIAAFKEAIRLGAHMIEFDVQMTKDGALVLMHDKTVDRTTNGQGAVADLSLEEIRKLDAGSWKNPIFKGEKVPTLAEALKIMPKNIWLNVHVKRSVEAGMAVAELIIKEKKINQAFIACKVDIANAVRKISDHIKICNMERQDFPLRYVQETISQQADFIQLTSRADDMLVDLTKQLKDNHIKINYYGANSPEKLKKLFDAGVEFPLIDEVENMINAVKNLGIKPLKPKY